MAVSLRKGFSAASSSSSSSGVAGWNKKKPLAGGPASSLGFSIRGEQMVLRESHAGQDGWAPGDHPVHAKAASVCIPRSLRWWDKGEKPNMIEIGSAQHLVDSLLNAGDGLVVVDFYSPGCGGCKALHPKMCQLADSSPDVLFLKVNYEEHRSLCSSLNVHVLPFFRFYRGARGRVCSFSCTNATIKKLKDAVAKHGGERCGAGPAKGLDELELVKLASNRELLFNFPLVSSRADDLGHDHDFPGYLGGGAAAVEAEMAALAL